MTNEELEKCEAILSKAGYLDGIETDPAKRIDSIFRISLNTALEHLKRITRDNAASPAGETELIEALNAATNGEISTIPDAVREEISQKLKERRISFTLVNTSKLSDFKLCLNYMFSDDGSAYYDAAAIRQYIITEEQLFDLRDPETGITLLEAAREAEKKSLKESRSYSIQNLPKNHTVLTSQISREIFSKCEPFTGENELQTFTVDNSRSKKKNHKETNTTAHLMLMYDDKDGKNSDVKPYLDRLDMYDLSVHDTVVTLCNSGHREFTKKTLYRLMTGKTGSEYVAPESCEKIDASMKKMRRILTNIDASEEVKKFKIKDEEGNIIDTWNPTLPLLDWVEMPYSQKTTDFGGYYIRSTPILYMHAQLRNNIATVSNEYLDIKDTENMNIENHKKMTAKERQELKKQVKERASIRMSDEIIIVRDYLIRNIKRMKHEKENDKKGNYNKRLTMENFYTATDTDAKNKDHCKYSRKRMKKVLNYYVAAGIIECYEFIKQGRNVHAVDITL